MLNRTIVSGVSYVILQTMSENKNAEKDSCSSESTMQVIQTAPPIIYFKFLDLQMVKILITEFQKHHSQYSLIKIYLYLDQF